MQAKMCISNRGVQPSCILLRVRHPVAPKVAPRWSAASRLPTVGYVMGPPRALSSVWEVHGRADHHIGCPGNVIHTHCDSSPNPASASPLQITCLLSPRAALAHGLAWITVLAGRDSVTASIQRMQFLQPACCFTCFHPRGLLGPWGMGVCCTSPTCLTLSHRTSTHEATTTQANHTAPCLYALVLLDPPIFPFTCYLFVGPATTVTALEPTAAAGPAYARGLGCTPARD